MFVHPLVYAFRKYSKTPLQLAYAQYSLSEPTTVDRVAQLTFPFSKELEQNSFPKEVVRGNAQIITLNPEAITEDLMFRISLKLKAW